MHEIDKLAEKNPSFFINKEDAENLAESLRRKGYDLPLVAVSCLYEVWSEEVYSAGWLMMGNYDRAAETLLDWIQNRDA